MKTHLIPATLCFLAFTVSAPAEIFVLKDGTRLEGRILSENDESYVVEVQITKSIRDERVLPKADVKSVERDQPDERAFEEIAALLPTPDLLSVQEYGHRTAAVESFLKQYPDSGKAEEARKILETLKKESDEVSAGGVKLDGEMILAKDYRANAYELDARVLAGEVQSLGERPDYVGALRAFARLQEEFQGSKAYDDVRPFVKKLIQSYDAQVSQLLGTYDARVAERKSNLSRLGTNDRSAAERALAEEDALIEKRYQDEKTKKQVWVTPHPFHKRSLEDAQRTAKHELSRIDNPRRITDLDGGEAYRNAWQAIRDNDPKEVKETLAKVRAARIPARYITALEESAKEAGIEF